MEQYIEIIAPVLRGLTFDGEKGKMVKFLEDKQDIKKLIDVYNSEVLNIESFNSLKGISEKEIIKHIVHCFNTYKKNNSKEPLLVMFDSIGLFIIGKSYKEINDIIESNMDVIDRKSIAKKTDRNDIVKNKISVVTGGAQGIGKEIVEGLVGAGSLVFIADINQEGAAKLSKHLNEQYNNIVSFSVKVNITEEESVKNMVLEIVESAGGIDIFINNAGVLKADSVKEMKLKDFTFVTDVNYTGYFLCTKYVSRIMALQNEIYGNYYTDIIQINSKSGLEGSKRNSAYAGSKFGGIGLTQSFALELVENNIKVNSICPGNFLNGPLWSDPDKGLFAQYLKVGKVPGAKTFEDVKKFYELKVPMKRGCTGEDLIKAIFYIIDQKYETGQALPVTGGQVMLK